MNGSPTLIFVHGGFCDRHDWRAQIDALAPDFKTVALDLPGHGQSPLPHAATISQLAQALIDVMVRTDAGSCLLVGHSLGCRVIIEAARRAAGVAGIVLLEGDRLADREPDQACARLNGAIAAHGLFGFLESAFKRSLGERIEAATQERILARLKRTNPRFAQDLLCDTIRWDVNEASHALAAVDVPLLVAQSTYVDGLGSRSSITPGASTPWLDLVRERAPGAEIRYLEGASHFAMLDAADTVTSLIADFARRTDCSA